MTPIQFLMSQIASLHNETAILEVCDWDEEKVDKLLANLNSMLMDLDSSLEDNMKRFCAAQDYISEYHRELLFDLLKQAITMGIQEQNRIDEEYEN